MLEIIFEILFLCILLFACFILLRFVRSESERAQARHQIFLQSLQSLSQSLEEIQEDFHDFVCEYVKPKD